MQAFFLRKFHERWLMLKVLNSFRKRKEFNELKMIINNICKEKNETNLLTKSFETLR